MRISLIFNLLYAKPLDVPVSMLRTIDPLPQEEVDEHGKPVAEEDRVGKAPPNYGAIYPCVQNILLACRAVGLGAALTTMHQVFEDELTERFGIPEQYGVVVTIPIGYPMGRFGPVSRRPASEVTYYERWGASSRSKPADE